MAAALSVSANSAAAAPQSAAAAAVEWSATHGSATASGTRWTERVDGPTSGQLKVCRGTTDTADCGDAISVTHWPINNVR
ncbi:hypothetical protein SAZ11_11485 [Streptomyces sp. FXJ1.4098]|nr:hypothetical protein [Streptomyces sp. FXJ1.4098]